MSKNWIIDVLGDLRGFAETNDMPSLARSLDDVIVVAVSELPQAPANAGWKEGDAAQGRRTGTFG